MSDFKNQSPWGSPPGGGGNGGFRRGPTPPDIDEIVKKFAKFSGIKIENIVVCILDRPRHKELINKVRSIGARIKLIPDGDVSAVIATSFEDSGVDIYMGIGGSPEGVLAASALDTF